MKKTREFVVGVMTLMLVLVGCANEGPLDLAPADELEVVSEELWGPLAGTCPVTGGCVRGGYGFGFNWDFGSCPAGTNKLHAGVDLRATVNTPVVAMFDGTVKLVYSAGTGWAQAVLIEHRDAAGLPFVAQYMHIDPTVVAGVRVLRGQSIGTIAAIASPHLHLGIWDGPYVSTVSAQQRGALPFAACGGDPAWPASFVDPGRVVSIGGSPSFTPIAIGSTLTSSLPSGGEARYSIATTPGQRYTVLLTPTAGDADLYTNPSAGISRSTWSCRPYLGALRTETCSFTAPGSSYYVLVHGFTATSYRITATSP